MSEEIPCLEFCDECGSYVEFAPLITLYEDPFDTESNGRTRHLRMCEPCFQLYVEEDYMNCPDCDRTIRYERQNRENFIEDPVTGETICVRCYERKMISHKIQSKMKEREERIKKIANDPCSEI